MILQRHNITKLFVFIYLFIAVWPLRIRFDGGGSIAVVQMLVLFIIFTLAIANSKGSLRLSADFDSTLLLVMLLYAILNISIHGIFDSENIPSQQRSLIAILFIGLPFYISRNFINIDIKIVVKITVYGLCCGTTIINRLLHTRLSSEIALFISNTCSKVCVHTTLSK